MLQTLPYFTQLLTMKTTQSQYELFQEWLNDCPTQIEDYQDNIDSVTIRFDTPFTEEN